MAEQRETSGASVILLCESYAAEVITSTRDLPVRVDSFAEHVLMMYSLGPPSDTIILKMSLSIDECLTLEAGYCDKGAVAPLWCVRISSF